VFDRDYQNPRIYTFNAAYEQEIAQDVALYFDFTYSKGTKLTRFLNYGRIGMFAPYLGDTFFHKSIGRSTYYGFTPGFESASAIISNLKRITYGRETETTTLTSETRSRTVRSMYFDRNSTGRCQTAT
jgi:hypothetical protein